MTGTIMRNELRAALDAGAVTLVDALPAEPYRRRHIPGALNLVIDEVGARAAQLLPDRAASVVTYSTDAACGRGETLAERLEQLGYADVRVYRDGIEDWAAAGLGGSPRGPGPHGVEARRAPEGGAAPHGARHYEEMAAFWPSSDSAYAR